MWTVWQQPAGQSVFYLFFMFFDSEYCSEQISGMNCIKYRM